MQKYITGKNGLRVNVPNDMASCNELCVKADTSAGPVVPPAPGQSTMRFDPPNDGLSPGAEEWLLIRSTVPYPAGAVLTITPGTRWPFIAEQPVTYSFTDVNGNPVGSPVVVAGFTPNAPLTISNMPAGAARVGITGQVRISEMEETYCVTLTAPAGFGNDLFTCTTVYPEIG